MTGAAGVALWFAGLSGLAVVEGLRASHRMRDDWWDRRLQGATTWGRVRWVLFDRDARRVIGGYVSAAVLAVLAVAAPVVVYPVETVVVVVALAVVVVAWRARRRRRRRRQRPMRDAAPSYGMYVLWFFRPGTRERSHGKVGEGDVPARLRRHHTVEPEFEVAGVIWTDSKEDAVAHQEGLRRALRRAGLLMPYQRSRQHGREKFYATSEAYRIVDGYLAAHGGVPYELPRR